VGKPRIRLDTFAARHELGATFPFLCDQERKVITELDIVDTRYPGTFRSAADSLARYTSTASALLLDGCAASQAGRTLAFIVLFLSL
jgi:hypothetical protein